MIGLPGSRGIRVRRDPERGAATVFAAFGLLALLSLTVLAVQVGGAVVAGHRVQSAADLAALAAAGALADGGDACAAARDSARANGVRVGSCAVEEQTVLVRALADLPVTGLPGPTDAAAVARAGWRIGQGMQESPLPSDGPLPPEVP